MTGVPNEAPQLLIVDSERVIADTLAFILRLHGYTCAAAYTGRQAIESAKVFRPRFVLIEASFTDMNAAEAAATILQNNPDCKIALMSGSVAGIETSEMGRALGVKWAALISKPALPADLVSLIEEQTGLAPKTVSPSDTGVSAHVDHDPQPLEFVVAAGERTWWRRIFHR